jgi:hypothetical protein
VHQKIRFSQMFIKGLLKCSSSIMYILRTHLDLNSMWRVFTKDMIIELRRKVDIGVRGGRVARECVSNFLLETQV